jgi:hypothetical protein
MDELADLAGSAVQGAEDLGGAAMGALDNEASDIAGVVTHGASAVGDAIGGDWDGAASEALSMSGSALGAATGGLTDLAGDAYDAVAGATGLPSAHDLVQGGLEGIGNDLGDAAYNLVHGGDSSGDTGGGSDPGAGGSADPGMDPGIVDDGSYNQPMDDASAY